VASDSAHQPRLRDYLRPLADRLVNHLVGIYEDQTLPQARHSAAANALTDYMPNDTERFAKFVGLPRDRNDKALGNGPADRDLAFG
jgi:hypothetical protein